MACFPPLKRFLCCLPLSTGVKLFLVVHLWELVLFGSWGVYDLVQDPKQVSFEDTTAANVFSAVWWCLGIPVILAGLYGAVYHVQSHLRLYYYYLAASFIIDVVHLVQLFLVNDACVHLDGQDLGDGTRFACGVARGISAVSVILLSAGLLYMIHIVWSFAEELADEGSAAIIEALMKRADGGKSRTQLALDAHRSAMATDEESVLLHTVESVAHGGVIVYGAVASSTAQMASALTTAVMEGIEELESMAGGTARQSPV